MTDSNIKCPLIDAATYATMRGKLNAFEHWREGRESYRPEDVPESLRDVGNEMRSHVYMYEEIRDKPAKTTYYIKDCGDAGWYIQNWTGDYVLARAEITRKWRNGRGQLRYSIRTYILGGTYIGQTAGPGMYINLRRVVA